MTQQMRALRSFPYAGHQVAKGSVFEVVRKADAHVLSVIGHAERVAQAQTYATRVMTADLSTGRDIGQMDIDALRAECDRRGLTYHHRAGASKLLALLGKA